MMKTLKFLVALFLFILPTTLTSAVICQCSTSSSFSNVAYSSWSYYSSDGTCCDQVGFAIMAEYGFEEELIGTFNYDQETQAAANACAGSYNC